MKSNVWHYVSAMRDLTTLLNVLAAFQLKARRLQRIADYGSYDDAIDAHPLAHIATARVDYLASFIRSIL